MALPFLDTNVLLRHFLQDHAEHSPRATAFLTRVERGEVRVHISDVVLFETVFILERQYRQPKPTVRDLVLGLIELPSVVLPAKHRWHRVVDRYVDANLPIADAYHTVLMEQLETDQIITFDRDFDRVPGIRRVEPS